MYSRHIYLGSEAHVPHFQIAVNIGMGILRHCRCAYQYISDVQVCMVNNVLLAELTKIYWQIMATASPKSPLQPVLLHITEHSLGCRTTKPNTPNDRAPFPPSTTPACLLDALNALPRSFPHASCIPQ
jgi:hypothetical protein